VVVAVMAASSVALVHWRVRSSPVGGGVSKSGGKGAREGRRVGC